MSTYIVGAEIEENNRLEVFLARFARDLYIYVWRVAFSGDVCAQNDNNYRNGNGSYKICIYSAIYTIAVVMKKLLLSGVTYGRIICARYRANDCLVDFVPSSSSSFFEATTTTNEVKRES